MSVRRRRCHRRCRGGHPDDGFCVQHAGGRPSPFLVSLSSSYSLFRSFPRWSGVRIGPPQPPPPSPSLPPSSEAPSFLPLSALTLTLLLHREERESARPVEHPEAPLNASPPLVSTSSPSRSGTTSQRERDGERGREESGGRARARSLWGACARARPWTGRSRSAASVLGCFVRPFVRPVVRFVACSALVITRWPLWWPPPHVERATVFGVGPFGLARSPLLLSLDT